MVNPGGGKFSILVIDDEKSNILALTGILSEDYRVLAVMDSLDAVETVLEDMPDLILLDILMPEMDGYEIITALKANEKTQHIPVIFITGLDTAEAEEKGLVLGAADYIPKPFNAAIVKIRVRNQVKILDQYRTIERISLLDQLTGIPNRRSFENRIRLEWGKAAREQMPLSLLVIDIDRFKIYNDTYGHQQGDTVLQTLAQSFSVILKRPADFAARWGGEEFTVLLPNTNPSGAMEVAEQMRHYIENMVIVLNDTITRITLSIGVFTRMPGFSCSIDEFITNADKALYRAKNTGRNRVCCYVDA
jgi:diguanylate cyclase (GGDEF)-like protein